MKTLFTACYSHAKTLPPEFPQVRTSRGVPEWWNPKHRIDALPFAPSQAVFAAAKADPPRNWKAAYRAQLDGLFKSGVLERVVSNLPENSVLLCYEHNPLDCHRSILAAYLVEKGLANVKEFTTAPAEQKKPKPPENPQLFLL